VTVPFVNTNNFIRTANFIKSEFLIQTKSFTKSSQNTASRFLHQSETVDDSNLFDSENINPSVSHHQSVSFCDSRIFHKSEDLMRSKGFATTDLFTESDRPSHSVIFNRTFQHLESQRDVRTDSFTYTRSLSRSSQFSFSNKFRISSVIPASATPSMSNQISLSDNLGKSDCFSETISRDSTGEFAQTQELSESTVPILSRLIKASIIGSNSAELQPSRSHQSHSFSATNVFESHNFISTKSHIITQEFDPSNEASQSEEYDKTKAVCVSDRPTTSNNFDDSHSFIPSESLTDSTLLKHSCQIISSNEFDSSGEFISRSIASSDDFLHSKSLIKSATMTMSESYDSSNAFESHFHSDSMEFAASSNFVNSESIASNHFDHTVMFHQSSLFSESEVWKHTARLPRSYDPFSREFPPSNQRLESHVLIATMIAARTNQIGRSVFVPITLSFDESKSPRQSAQYDRSDGFSSHQFHESVNILGSGSIIETAKHFPSDALDETKSPTDSMILDESRVGYASHRIAKSETFSSQGFNSSEEAKESQLIDGSASESLSNHIAPTIEFLESIIFDESQTEHVSKRFDETKVFDVGETEIFSSNQLYQSHDIHETEHFISNQFDASIEIHETKSFNTTLSYDKTDDLVSTIACQESFVFQESLIYPSNSMIRTEIWTASEYLNEPAMQKSSETIILQTREFAVLIAGIFLALIAIVILVMIKRRRGNAQSTVESISYETELQQIDVTQDESDTLEDNWEMEDFDQAVASAFDTGLSDVQTWDGSIEPVFPSEADELF
jgi:hypothetical protein